MDPRAPSPVRVAYGSDKGENKEELLQPTRHTAERKARRTPERPTAVDRNDECGCGSSMVRAIPPPSPSSSPSTSTAAAAAAAILSLEFQNLKRFHFASTHDNAAGRDGGGGSGGGRTPGPCPAGLAHGQANRQAERTAVGTAGTDRIRGAARRALSRPSSPRLRFRK